MFSLSIVRMEMCSSIDGPMTVEVNEYVISGLFCERTYPRCTCKAYKFSKRTINFGGQKVPPICKHIRQVQRETCGWHQQYSSETLKKSGTCPRCGASTIFVSVGV